MSALDAKDVIVHNEDKKVKNGDLLEAVRAYHDVWAIRYDTDYKQRAGLYHAVTLARLTQYLPIDPDVPVLDAGGGTGIWAEELLRQGFRHITLVDSSSGMLNIARRKLSAALANGTVNILQGDITCLEELPDGEFGCVLALGDVLSYCNFTEQALCEFFRVARRGATLIVSVESRLGRAEELLEIGDVEGAQSAIECGVALIGNPSWSRPFRARLFEPDEIQGLLVQAGFEIVSVVGKAIVRTSISIDEIDSPRYRWLIDFELANGDNPSLIRRARWIEVVARKSLDYIPSEINKDGSK